MTGRPLVALTFWRYNGLSTQDSIHTWDVVSGGDAFSVNDPLYVPTQVGCLSTHANDVAQTHMTRTYILVNSIV